jgi:SPP1 family predicted phage head-tail adaptor
MAKPCVKYVVGKMDKRMDLLELTRTTDGQGGFTEVWNQVSSVWANLEPASGYSKFQAHQLQNPISHNAICRYRSDITPAKRLRYDSRIFLIKESLNMHEAGAFMKLRLLEQP